MFFNPPLQHTANPYGSPLFNNVRVTHIVCVRIVNKEKKTGKCGRGRKRSRTGCVVLGMQWIHEKKCICECAVVTTENKLPPKNLVGFGIAEKNRDD